MQKFIHMFNIVANNVNLIVCHQQ